MKMSACKAPSHFAFECLISLEYSSNRILFSFLESSFSTMTVNMAYVISGFQHRSIPKQSFLALHATFV